MNCSNFACGFLLITASVLVGKYENIPEREIEWLLASFYLYVPSFQHPQDIHSKSDRSRFSSPTFFDCCSCKQVV